MGPKESIVKLIMAKKLKKRHKVIIPLMLLFLNIAITILMCKNYGTGRDVWEKVPVIPILLAASVDDISRGIISDRIFTFGVLAAFTTAFIIPQYSVAYAIIGFIEAVVVMWVIYGVTRGGIGFGDIKLAGCIGLFLGPEGVMNLLVLAALIGGVTGLTLLASNTSKLKSTMPFAPILYGSYLFAVIFKLI